MWFSVVSVIIVVYILHLYHNSIRALFLSRKTIGPPAFPIIGSALYFLNKTAAGIVCDLCVAQCAIKVKTKIHKFLQHFKSFCVKMRRTKITKHISIGIICRNL